MSPTTAKAVFNVRGMHCASCVSHVEKALRSVPGVTDAAVNLATERASVRFNPRETTQGTLERAVRDAGYEASPAGLRVQHEPETHPPGHAHGGGEEDAAAWGRRALVGAVLGTPAVLLGMFVPGTGSGLVQLVLAAILQVYIGRAYYRGAWNAARHGRADMDTLIALGTSAALGYSVYPLATGAEHYYFDTAVAILALIAVGKWMEARARQRTGAAITSLLRFRPPRAFVIRDGVEKEIGADEVRVGDTIAVRPGGRVPADGKVTEGRAVLDESMVTGESMPVEKGPGDEVIGGTLNQAGAFRFVATHLGADSLLGQIVTLVEEAQASKAGVQRLADAVAGVFVPIVIVFAAATCLAWGGAGSWSGGIISAVAVLIVACPCALGLATPAAVMVGTGVGAANGILIRNAATLERVGRLDVAILDKTGTLTEGRPRVVEVAPIAEGLAVEAALRLAASVEVFSEHPIARAIVRHARSLGIEPVPAREFRSRTGGGVSAVVDEKQISVGRPEGGAAEQAASLAAQGLTVVLLSEGTPEAGRPLALLALADTLKPGAADAVAALRDLGLRILLLTGDNAATGAEIGRQAGIAEVISGVRPQDKEAKVSELRSAGHGVAMVGDGVNDAPALAAATVGIAMGNGTDIAQNAGDIVIVSGDPALIPGAIRLSRAMIRRIRLGLFWAFAYNVILIPVAATGWLHPMFAAGAMSLSSVCVLANALLLKRFRVRGAPEGPVGG